MADHNLKSTVNFLFEAGMLAQTPRSFSGLLGGGRQSVAEHLNRVCYIGYVLSIMEGGNLSVEKILKMCLFHDFAEARVSDLNYVNQKYVDRHEDRAVQEFTKALDFGGDVLQTVEEYEARETPESIIVKDADNLEFILSLKEQVDIGNARAADWLPPAIKRLKTESAKKLAEEIMNTKSDEWWFGDKDDKWWVSREK